MNTFPLLEVQPFTVSGTLLPAFGVSFLAYLESRSSLTWLLLLMLTPAFTPYELLRMTLYNIICAGTFGVSFLAYLESRSSLTWSLVPRLPGNRKPCR